MSGRWGDRQRGEPSNLLSVKRTRVKICGITNREDAEEAARLGADYLGFIRVPDTPRYVADHEFLWKIAGKAGVPLSGNVFARTSLVRVVRDLYETKDFDPFQVCAYAQYYTDTTPYGRFADDPRLIPAFSIRDRQSLEAIEAEIQLYNIQPSLTFALLLDAYHEDKLGGSGETFNWEIAVEAKERFELPIILAGGLTPENVGEAIRQVRPYAVDVSSGVEAEPGRKDYAKLAAFFEAVRQADTTR